MKKTVKLVSYADQDELRIVLKSINESKREDKKIKPEYLLDFLVSERVKKIEKDKLDKEDRDKLGVADKPKLPIYKDIKEFLSSMDLIPNLKRGNKMSEVYTRYCKYCLNNGYSAMSNRNLLSELEDLKVMIRISTGNQYYIYGYTLPELTEEDEEWEL